jgi:signal transduction histidine kinase
MYLKNHYALPFSVLFAGIIIIASWMFWIVPELQNDATEPDVSLYIGKSSDAEKFGDKMPPYVPIYVSYVQQPNPFNSTVLKVSSTFATFDALTDKKLWDSNRTDFVDKITGKFLGFDNAYFRFPTNTLKQNYNVFLYADGNPQPFVFDQETSIDGLKVYKFSCKLTADLSDTYPQFSPNKIMSDYTSSIWVEPTTGNEILYQEHWEDYGIVNGTKIPVSVGMTHTIDFAKQLAIEKTKNDLQNYFLYDTIIPLTSILVLAGTCVGIMVYQKQQRKLVEVMLEREKDHKLSAIGLLASRLAHDIRNPLSVVKSAVALMKSENPSEKNQSRFEMIDRAISRITHQIDDVMDFVRNKPLNINEVDISKVINKTMSLIEIPLGISINVESHDIKLQCDSKQLEVVLNNLIANAIESIGDKGTINIRVKEIDDLVHMSIEDSGPGVPSDLIEKIFEPLFTTKQTGTGLGLVSCKNIVEQHGGKITVSNNPSTFTIILPKKHHEKKT